MAIKAPKEKKPKPPKEKKPKPPKPPKEKKPKKPKKVKNAAVDDMEGIPEEEGGKKRKLPLLVFILVGAVLIAAAALIVIFVVIPKLSGEGDVPEPEPSEDPGVYYELPEQFEVGEVKVSAPQPLIAANVQAIKSVRVVYTYVDLTDAGAEVANYVSDLVSKEGLYVVDEEFVRTDAPDFTVPEGEVLLAKNLPKAETKVPAEGQSEGASAPAAEPVDMVLTVRLSWEPGTCVIVGDQEEGQVTNPPRGNNSPSSGATMSLNGALDYVKGLSPSVLGLSGESMDDYKVYALEGSAMVNGMPCIRMKVYSRDNPKGTNELAGSYLLSNDGQHLYQLDEVAGKVTELKLP